VFLVLESLLVLLGWAFIEYLDFIKISMDSLFINSESNVLDCILVEGIFSFFLGTYVDEANRTLCAHAPNVLLLPGSYCRQECHLVGHHRGTKISLKKSLIIHMKALSALVRPKGTNNHL
jgi:hypothetical protein